MAPELSSNWKKLQAQIKTESTATSSPSLNTTTKRKTDAGPSSHSHSPKRQKLQTPSRPQDRKSSSSKPPTKPSRKSNPKSLPESPMGVTQSSALARGTPTTITPSLALWAEDNDISPEDLAEAYSLGAKHNASFTAAAPPRVNEGLAPGVEVGKYIALDCEMVGVGPEGRESVLARVSVVDFHGRQVYDSFVTPRERVTDFRTHITGITPRVLATARTFDEVQGAVAELFKDRIVVGHDIRHDLAVLQLSHPSGQVRDTARFAGYRKYGHGPKPALRVLAREVLGVEIQNGHHSSIEDARVAMLLFRKKKSDFDVQHASRYGLPVEKTTASESVGGDDGNSGGGSGKGSAKSKNGQGKKKKKKR
ncbi:ribonuclease H-like domain-containing protein [Annulohypoxylon maeteangense]|uniref:ribonuclease H-like domain-containing protein n=1 Tax=Annulohypoxylon maeteangense TaxID=1927788 RepID=UPI0020079CF1|nr:ribonuclease H-like domain-containing protein [Annulohypoxylon maeteangense]KAI0889548.1 ribonuclease H-like domain-containing protein [Annulohypoxylon maeteangense]